MSPFPSCVLCTMQQKLQLMCTSVVRRNMKPAAILQEMDAIKLRRRFPITFAAWHYHVTLHPIGEDDRTWPFFSLMVVVGVMQYLWFTGDEVHLISGKPWVVELYLICLDWLVLWNIWIIFPIIFGSSSSQLFLTPSFFRGVVKLNSTTKQLDI